MKAGHTYIVAKDIIDAAQNEGATVYEQKGFYKIGKSPVGPMFIGNNKDEPAWVGEQFLYASRPSKGLEGNVARIDLSGFTVEQSRPVNGEFTNEHLAFDLGGESFGRVHQQLRFDLSKAEILANVKLLVIGLGTHKALPKKERQKPVALKGSKPAENKGETTEVQVVAALTPEQEINKLVAKRKMLIEMGNKTGKPVSEKTLALISEKLATLGYVEAN